MKSILIIFCFCFALPLGINAVGGESSQQGEHPYQRAMRKFGDSFQLVVDLAGKGQSINNAVKPMRFVDCGGLGFVFRGVMQKDNRPVAIKFVNKNNAEYARREYEMYSYLRAVNKTDVEKYGITAVYYHGTWKNFVVTAYTDLELTLANLIDLGQVETYDILSVIHQFIKTSKYIHSKGIRHDDVKLENILTKNCQSFLIDFDLASKMMEDNKGQSILMAPLRFHRQENRVPMDDWESFLYTMCDLSGVVHLDWFDKSLADRMRGDKRGTKQMIGDMKANRARTHDIIKNSLYNNLPLQTVLVALADEVFSGKQIPGYDEFDAFLTDILGQAYPNQKCFSWVLKNFEGEIIDLSYQERVLESIAKKHEVRIGDIKVPTNFAEYRKFKYPSVK